MRTFLFAIHLCFFGLAFGYEEVHAQGTLRFRNLGTESGLSYHTVLNVFQDSKGFLWLSTDDGLNKYDGYNFTAYHSVPTDAATLSNSSIRIVKEDADGNLWIGTNCGLNKYDRKEGRIYRFYPDPATTSIQTSSNFITDIHINPNGTLWIGTRGAGLMLFDPIKKTFKPFRHEDKNTNSLSNDYVTKIIGAGEGKLWIGTDGGGVCLFDPLSGLFKNYRHHPEQVNSLSHDGVKTLFLDPDGYLWVGTFGHGLNRLNPQTGRCIRYMHRPGDESSLSSNGIEAIIQPKEKLDHLWVATIEGGINFLDTKTGKFSVYRNDPKDINSIAHNTIYDVLEDKTGNLWMGTTLGLSFVNPKAPNFNLYQNNARNPNLLSDNFVLSLLEDRTGSLWVGTKSGGLTRLELHTGNIKKYLHNPEKPGTLSSNTIQTIYEDRDGTLWIGTAWGGLNKYNPVSDTFQSYANTDVHNTALNYLNDIHSICEDKKQNLWLGTHAGLVYFDRELKTFTPYPYNPADEKSVSSNIISKIMYTRDGRFWVSTWDSGLNLYHPENQTFTRYQHHPKDEKTISDNRICALFQDSEDRIWIGTHNGLNLFDPKTGIFTRYYQKHGLPDNAIYGILEDDYGFIWLSTRNGISRMDPKKQTFHNFSMEAGLQSNSFAGQINFGAHTKSRNGKLYFGGPKGFNEIDPNQTYLNDQPPLIALTAIRVNNRPFRPAADLDQMGPVKLNFEENVLSFDFAALDYSQPNQNQFAYQLEGLDPDWIYSGSQHYANYTNLSPGTYRFRVKAANPDGVWNEAGTSFSFIIHPPFWRTWIAYVLYASFGFGLLFTFWKYSLAQERLKAELKGKQYEKEKLKELDEFRSRFFTNVSHEFRTPLTLILGTIDQLLEKPKIKHGRKGYYRIMQRNAKRLHQLINQLLDIAKLESGNMKQELKSTDLVQDLAIITSNFTSYKSEGQLDLRFDSDLPKLELLADNDKIEKIVYNLLSNACKFTPPGGHVLLQLRIAENSAQDPYLNGQVWCVLEVKDTGVGIPADQLPHIFDRFYQVDGSHTRIAGGTGIGLSLTYELVRLLQGTITVRSTEGLGTCFTVTLPFQLVLEAVPIVTAENMELPPYILGSTHKALPILIENNNIHTTQSKPLLLIVEDNSDLRWYLIKTLSPYYQVLEAQDGISGFEMAIENIPDMIISDLMMPFRDGLELCLLLKADQRTDHIPFILLTAKATVESRIKGLEHGADDYLTKPFNKEELLVRAKNMVSQRKKLQDKYSHISSLPAGSITVTSADERFLQKAIALVEANLSEPDFSVETFGREIGLSRMQLHRKITALTGQTASEFIRKIRLQRAAALLKQNWGNVAEVAYAVGFQNLSYFSKCFREEFSVSPSAYTSSSHSNTPN